MSEKGFKIPPQIIIVNQAMRVQCPNRARNLVPSKRLKTLQVTTPLNRQSTSLRRSSAVPPAPPA